MAYIFFIGALSGVAGLGEAVPSFNVIFGTASGFFSSFYKYNKLIIVIHLYYIINGKYVNTIFFLF